MKTPSSNADEDFLNLIVLSAVHRSGSTLLQRICNARRGTLIWGEHGGMLLHFQKIHLEAAHFIRVGSPERIEYFQRGEDPNLWIPNMCPDISYLESAIVMAARALLNALYRQHRESHDIVGFKEVRYGARELELLRKCYPAAEFLLIVRHPYNTWNTTDRTWFPSLEAWADTWEKNTNCYLQTAQTDGRSHLIRYESLVAREEPTMKILTEAAQVSRKEIAGVLAHKIGSFPVGIDEREKEIISHRCRNTMNALGYT